MRAILFKILFFFQIHKLFRQKSSNEIPILLYHRIDNNIDPYWPSTTIENFKNHIKLLSKQFNFIALDELIRLKIRENCIAIVFDDAYEDIFKNAIPILEDYNIPYTVFIATENCLTTEPIWTSKLDWIVNNNDTAEIAQKLERTFQIVITSISNKIKFAAELQNKLKMESNSERLTMVNFLVENFISDTPPWLKIKSLEEIKNENLKHINIELHTHTHPYLPSCSHEEITKEIKESLSIYSSYFNKKSRYLAYPMGGYNEEIIQLIKDDFKAAFAVENKCVDIDKLRRDIYYKYQIPRFNLSNQSAEELIFRIRGFHKKIFNR